MITCCWYINSLLLGKCMWVHLVITAGCLQLHLKTSESERENKKEKRLWTLNLCVRQTGYHLTLLSFFCRLKCFQNKTWWETQEVLKGPCQSMVTACIPFPLLYLKIFSVIYEFYSNENTPPQEFNDVREVHGIRGTVLKGWRDFSAVFQEAGIHEEWKQREKTKKNMTAPSLLTTKIWPLGSQHWRAWKA